MPTSLQPNDSHNEYISTFPANSFLIQIDRWADQLTVFSGNHTILPALPSMVSTGHVWLLSI